MIVLSKSKSVFRFHDKEVYNKGKASGISETLSRNLSLFDDESVRFKLAVGSMDYLDIDEISQISGFTVEELRNGKLNR